MSILTSAQRKVSTLFLGALKETSGRALRLLSNYRTVLKRDALGVFSSSTRTKSS